MNGVADTLYTCAMWCEWRSIRYILWWLETSDVWFIAVFNFVLIATMAINSNIWRWVAHFTYLSTLYEWHTFSRISCYSVPEGAPRVVNASIIGGENCVIISDVYGTDRPLAKLLCTQVFNESFNNSGLQSISFLSLKNPIYNTWNTHDVIWYTWCDFCKPVFSKWYAHIQVDSMNTASLLLHWLVVWNPA